MSAIKSILPRTNLAAYAPNSEVNFDLTGDVSEALVPGSVFLTGKLVVPNAAAANNNFYDPNCGVASVFENVIVRCDVFQEIISNYPRYVKQINALQYSTDAMCQGLKQSHELLAPHVLATRPILQDAAAGMPFAHRFMNSINNMSGALSFAKSGRIQLSFKLAPGSKVFFGSASAALAAYTLTDLELHYKTTQTAADSVSVEIVQDTQKLITTSDTTIFNSFVDPISQLMVAFADVAVENTDTMNALACQHPPIQRISWQWQDQSNRLVAYNVETVEEMVLSALDLMKTRGVSIDMRQFQTAAVLDPTNNFNDKFMLGLDLGQLMDFSRTPIGVNVRMAAGQTTNYYAYFYGLGRRVIV